MNKRPKSREETPKEGSDSNVLPHGSNIMLRCTKFKNFRKFHFALTAAQAAAHGRLLRRVLTPPLYPLTSGLGGALSRGPTLGLRRRAEAVLRELRTEIAEACTKLADEQSEPPLDVQD
jgi:hypothetical protein